ncbi:MAG: type 1 periplasmic binding fold superfamily protein [Myxococcota bacterium]
MTQIALLALAACGDVTKPEETNPQEVITTVALTFTPASGGVPLAFAWADPENDGDPVIDDVVLSDAEDYGLAVSFLNELEDPAEDITEEVAAESDEHQIFYTGSAIEGPATGENAGAVVAHAYDDSDANGLPVGLSNTISTLGVGNGTLTVTLRHLPPENDVATKTATLAEDVAAGGFEAIPGETDAQVEFPVLVE